MAKISTKALARYAADQIESGKDPAVIAKQVAALLLQERRSRDVGTFGRLLESELAQRGTTQVVITSAAPVDNVIKERLADMLGAKKALFHEVIDDSVIGGVHASTLDAQLDLTIAGQLKAFKQAVNKEAI
jgi:F0F1-type ATP synthase delta subunit